MSKDPHAIKKSISVAHVVKILNRMLEEDPVATRQLFLEARVPCNSDLADDPTIQVRTHLMEGEEELHSVGILGVLNGLFGIDDGGWGPITMIIEFVCTVGCKLPDEMMVTPGEICPVCKERGVPDEEAGIITFGPIQGFMKTQPPGERREGPP